MDSMFCGSCVYCETVESPTKMEFRCSCENDEIVMVVEYLNGEFKKTILKKCKCQN